MTLGIRRPVVQFAAVAAVLGLIAAAMPRPWYTAGDNVYATTGRQFIVRDCADIHCFRVLVSWLVGPLPGSSLVKWRTFDVLACAGAAVAVGRLCILLGLSSRAALLATWLSALGFGSLYATFDAYTSDPLMFLLGPVLMGELLAGHRGRAGAFATIGVLAKEFAAAPLWMFTIWAALLRRWELAARVLLAAMAVTLVWITFQIALMTLFNYSYAGNTSADVLGGGYLTLWLRSTPPRVAAAAIFGEYGALYLLIPVGVILAQRDLRLLALAAVPAAIALAYVEQPDRALWNFHFIAIPLAVLVLERLPGWAGALFVACYGFANLRLGAQLPFIPAARFALGLSMVIGVAAIVATAMTQTASMTLARAEVRS